MTIIFLLFITGTTLHYFMGLKLIRSSRSCHSETVWFTRALKVYFQFEIVVDFQSSYRAKKE